MGTHLRATERQLPYGITQGYGITCHRTQYARLNPSQVQAGQYWLYRL